jgi:hypothetical protein
LSRCFCPLVSCRPRAICSSPLLVPRQRQMRARLSSKPVDGAARQQQSPYRSNWSKRHDATRQRGQLTGVGFPRHHSKLTRPFHHANAFTPDRIYSRPSLPGTLLNMRTALSLAPHIRSCIRAPHGQEKARRRNIPQSKTADSKQTVSACSPRHLSSHACRELVDQTASYARYARRTMALVRTLAARLGPRIGPRQERDLQIIIRLPRHHLI